MRLTSGFLLMFFTLSVVYGQDNFSIQGTLTDESNQAVPFANVALYNVEKQLITGVASDLNGHFILSNVAAGNYSIDIQFVGYETFSRSDIKVEGNVDLGNIVLNESSQVLGEVVITGEVIEKPLEITAEGMTINPSQNLSNVGGSVLDVLRNSPSINVDSEGAISLRGSGSTNILVNGRNSSLSANLDQIPASAVKSIKVINNPGAKYDADAKGGIINIELKKGEGLGTHGNVDLSYGTGDRYNASAKVSHQTKDILAYLGYDIRQWVNNGTSTVHRETYGDNPQLLDQQGNVKRKSLNQNLKYGIDYFFGNNQLTYEGVYRKGRDRDNESRVSDLYAGGLREITNRLNYETEDGDAMDNALIYERTFSKEDQSFKAQISHSSRGNMEIQNIESLALSSSEIADRQRGITDEGRDISAFQVDYAHPFSNGGKFETGYKTVLRDFDNDFNFEVFQADQNTWENDERVSNRFRYKEQVHAFYVSYGRKFEKFNFSIGNRFEQAQIDTRQYTTNERNEQSYFNIFPSANFQYHLSEKQDVRLTYSRRIDRPGAGRLNPFPDIADSLNIRTGNPGLQPEYIQSMELGQHVTFNKFDLTTTLFYRHTSGIIDYIVTVDENGISHGRPENLNNGHDIGLEVIGSTNFTPWWNMNISYSVYQSTIDGSNINASFTNQNIAWNSKLVSDFTLPHNTRLQLTGNYASAEVEAQGEDFARYFVDASVAKTFKEDKLKVSLTCRDIFNTWKFAGTSYGDGFFQEWSYKPESRLLYLSVGVKI